MQGRIVKGIGGFYYISVVESAIYECKAKGGFRKQGIKPLVGDFVEIEILDEEKKIGTIQQILPRKNALLRPEVANVDQVLVVFALSRPRPHLNLLDRFLVRMEREKVPVVICWNKEDLVEEAEKKRLQDIYQKTGYPSLFLSGTKRSGLQAVEEYLVGKTTVLAGTSGVGKSTLLNAFYPEAQMETGEISFKIERGKHTTRHSELFSLGEKTYLMDTPGFSSLTVLDFEKEELKQYFPEFAREEGSCKYVGCDHIHEPQCRIKQLVELGSISKERYKSYQDFYQELQEKRRF